MSEVHSEDTAKSEFVNVKDDKKINDSNLKTDELNSSINDPGNVSDDQDLSLITIISDLSCNTANYDVNELDLD